MKSVPDRFFKDYRILEIAEIDVRAFFAIVFYLVLVWVVAQDVGRMEAVSMLVWIVRLGFKTLLTDAGGSKIKEEASRLENPLSVACS